MVSRESFTVRSDLDRLDFDKVHQWLSTDPSAAPGRTRETVQRAADASLNFGVYSSENELCGYARVVTDFATFAWLCDVYVPPAFRGNGLALLVMEKVVETLKALELRRVLLTTQNTHGLYRKVGFVPFPDPHKLMILDGLPLPARE